MKTPHPCCLLAVLVVLGAERTALAEPQANVGVRPGISRQGQEGSQLSSTRFQLGLRGDILYGRARNADWGWGPFVEGSTTFHSDTALSGGLSLLCPVHPYLPLVFSVGGGGGYREQRGWEPGVTADLFWGTRSFNYDSTYVMAGGLVLSGRRSLGDSQESQIVLAAHLDGEVLALPFVLLYQALR